jgi:diguanylate cyclase (GGDEF)-like protein
MTAERQAHTAPATRQRDELPPVAMTLAWVLLGSAMTGLLLFLLFGPAQGDGLDAPRAWLSVGVVGLAAIAGPLLPRLTNWVCVAEARTWPVPFILAMLFAWGLPAAIVLLVASSVVGAVVSRRPFAALGYAIGRQSLALVGAALVALMLSHDAPDVPGIVQPSNVRGLVVCLLAGGAFLVVDIVLDGVRRAVLYARSVAGGISGAVRARALVGAAHIALAPMFALVMNVSPWLTWLVFVPVISLHRSATSSRENAWAARHDDLTGLANRHHFATVAGAMIAESRSRLEEGRRPARHAAMLLLDLDGFKDVNEVARRLADRFDDAKVLARLGGDEFALLFAVADIDEAKRIARRVYDVLAEPYLHDGITMVDVDASIGVAVAPDHANHPETLFARADAAMYRAKRRKTCVEVYEPASQPTVSRVGIIGSLRRALEESELFLEYQPKVSLATRRVVGVEALVRWRHPSGVIVPPDDFIPAAERSGLMPKLTDAVLRMALADVRAWRRNGIEVPVSVNISAMDMMMPGFIDSIAGKLAEYRVPARHLTLEVTERVLVHDLPRARDIMVKLNKLGIRLAIDDFGTGWSSLLMLRTLPVCEVKLDRSFVSRAVDSDVDRAIVAKATELAHALELTVVAEGVETEQILDRLARLGCDEAQGWHVARAMSAEELMGWSAAYLATLANDEVWRGVPQQKGAFATVGDELG